MTCNAIWKAIAKAWGNHVMHWLAPWLYVLALAIAAGGCAYTQIEIPLPDGSRAFYRSTRDSDITGLHVEITPEGHVTIDLEGASGQASPIIEAWGQVMAAGLRALAEGASP